MAGNTRLEQELLILRQKLTRGSQVQISDTYTSNTTAMLESELKRVQNLVGDMQRQRLELSQAVKQLTENSTKLYLEIGNKEHLRNGEHSGSAAAAGGGSGGGGSIKKRTNSGCWFETDLDSMMSVNRSLTDSTMNLSTPLFVDTSGTNNTSGNLLNSSSTSSKLSDYNTGDSLTNESHRRGGGSSASYRYNDSSDNLETSGVDSDGFLDSNPFANLSQQEKQEIKTVRIVKRESERRHRDRSERSGLSNSTQNLDQVMEEEQYALMNGGGIGLGAGVGAVGNGSSSGNYHNDEYKTNERSKSLPRSYNEPPKSSRHHHRHRHGSSSSNSNNSSNHHNASSSSTNHTMPSTSSSSYTTSTNTSYKQDYYAGHNGQASTSNSASSSSNTHASNGYDKNSNYSHQNHASNNGHNSSSSNSREHLNPLANAYFAKQMQQHQVHSSTSSTSANQHQHHHHHHQTATSHSRHSSQNALRQKTDSQQSLNKSLSDLTPSFQSEAARQIMNEMSAGSASEDTESKVVEKVPSQHKHRRAVPKEKRRHYTAPNNVVNVKTTENGQSENDMNKNVSIMEWVLGGGLYIQPTNSLDSEKIEL